MDILLVLAFVETVDMAVLYTCLIIDYNATCTSL